MKTYFTSDWHLGEDRIGINGKPNLFYRPFDSVYEQDLYIEEQVFKVFKDGDVLYHLGDVVYNMNEDSKIVLQNIRIAYPNSKFILVTGNYDIGKEEILKDLLFDEILDSHVVNQNSGICHSYRYETDWELDGTQFVFSNEIFMNHYPINLKQHRDDNKFCLTGHIHGLWKVKPNIINVSVDAWHFKPVSLEEIMFCFNAMENHYDENVFLK